MCQNHIPPIAPFTRELLRWFSENGRELPWRETKDPYAIWLSEVILQQTRIQQGMAYWQRFISRWPTVEALAKATEDEVLREWQGLGYYSRARNLRHAARQIVEMGQFPKTMPEILSLKGVGDYTAAAIGSFAFDLEEAVVDGNVFRVLSRHFGVQTPIDTTEGKKEFKALAQSLLPFGHSSSFNQAMMDFGAIQCTQLSPKCHSCPMQETCVALREGRIDTLPVKSKKIKVTERNLTYIYIRWDGQTAIHRRNDKDIWQGLWEPLIVDDIHALNYKGRLTLLEEKVKHVLTHRILWVDFYLLETNEQPSLPKGYIWIKEQEYYRFALPRIIEILIAKIKGE